MTDTKLDAVIAAMTKFASNTGDDRLSVAVARVAQRLQHQGAPFETPLTGKEQRIVNMFINAAVPDSK